MLLKRRHFLRSCASGSQKTGARCYEYTWEYAMLLCLLAGSDVFGQTRARGEGLGCGRDPWIGTFAGGLSPCWPKSFHCTSNSSPVVVQIPDIIQKGGAARAIKLKQYTSRVHLPRGLILDQAVAPRIEC